MSIVTKKDRKAIYEVAYRLIKSEEYEYLYGAFRRATKIVLPERSMVIEEGVYYDLRHLVELKRTEVDMWNPDKEYMIKVINECLKDVIEPNPLPAFQNKALRKYFSSHIPKPRRNIFVRLKEVIRLLCK